MGIVVLIVLFILLLFGFTGLKTVLIIPLFVIPFYLISKKFELKEDERLIFSLFIGLGLYSAFVYLIARVIGSIRISLIIVFILLLVIGFLVKKKS